jgi:hypothetical protein
MKSPLRIDTRTLQSHPILCSPLHTIPQFLQLPHAKQIVDAPSLPLFQLDNHPVQLWRKMSTDVKD